MDIRRLLQDSPILQLVSKRRENFDVWDRIASFVPKETQCVLSLVSKSLTGVMQRRIFRHLSLEVEHEAHDDDEQIMATYNRCDIRQRETIQRLIGIVSAGLAPRVRTFKVLGMDPDFRHFSQRWTDDEYDAEVLGDHILLTHAQLQAAVIPVFFATLGQYTGLQTLWLEKIELGLSTHAAFASLHNLVNLRMDTIILLAPFAPSIQFRLKNLAMTKIAYPHELRTVDPLPVNFCAPQSLEYLLLGKLDDGSITSQKVMNFIVQNGGEFINLFYLEVKISKDDLQIFLPLLSGCPVLEFLLLNGSPSEGDFLRQGEPDEDHEDVLPDITPDACPKLAGFKGPFEVAEKIVPGRPIGDLHIEDDGFAGTRRSFESIRQLLRTLNDKEMRILKYEGCQTTKARKLLHYVFEHYKNLEDLRITVYDYPDDVLPTFEQCREWQRIVQHREHEAPNHYDYFDEEDEGEENFLDASRYPLRAEDTGEVDVEQHYRGGFMRLLAEVATGIIEVPDMLEGLTIVQSLMFKRQKYTESHEAALISEIERNPTFDELVCLHIGIQQAAHWYGRDENGGGRLHRENVLPRSDVYREVFEELMN